MDVVSSWIPLVALLLWSLTPALTSAETPMPDSVLDVVMDDIDGKPYALAQHRGQVLMLVNVASRCGNTPQYAGLEALYERFKSQGLVVIGIPANDFGAHEPGSNAEIAQFCSSTYHVSFPMLGKVSVKGDDMVPLYRYLTTKGPKPGDITWNFAKFLVGRDGQVADRFDPKTKPDDLALVAAVQAALGKPGK